MDKDLRLQHGEHNEKLCDHLLTMDEFGDWVVTSTFYACVHFVEHKIFPAKIDNRKHLSFNDYYSYVRNTNKRNTSKHNLKAELVKKKIPGIGSHYRHLLSVCSTARYLDYRISPAKAKNARSTMKIIKSACA